MTITEVIEKAIEGGFEAKIKFGRPFKIEPESEIGGLHITNGEMFIDPAFWQALGKAMGWKIQARDEATRRDNPSINMPTYEWEYQGAVVMKSWLYHWHHFIDHLAEGKDIESFFETL